jgi:hypothetical protein
MDRSTQRIEYSAAGCRQFNATVKAELDRWWTKRGLAHWLPRIRLGLWMVRNCYVVTNCIRLQGETLAIEEARAAVRA